MATSNTSGSAGPTRTSGRKRADQVSNSHPNRSSRHRRTNPQLAVQEPPSPKNVPGSTTSPQHQLTPEPFSSFLISPQHTQSSVSPAATQSLPVTPLFQLEPSPSPFHPDITVDSELLGGHGIRLSTRSSIAFPISSDPTQVATLPPKVAQSLPATPLFPSDQSCSALQPLITMESTQTYPTSNLTAQHATSQAVFSVPQPNMPHSHSAYLFQPFGIPPLSSSSLNNTPPSIIPYASTSSSYVGFGQAVQEPTFSLLQYGLGSVANTPLEFSFDQSGGDAGMSLTGGMSPFYGTSTRKSF
ncbi:hypothetical protein FRC03_000857 [Tulasnella sp. 419]|nr:hypothetical protein FRC03_000857 [Tulasnella sp. 419]